MRPAISLMGASKGSRPSGVWTVSYATAYHLSFGQEPRGPFIGREVQVREKSVWPGRKRSYSWGWGSLTLTIRSASANTSSAVPRTVAPAAT